MAGKKVFPNGTVQYTFKKAGVLDKPKYKTFDDETVGDAYALRVDALLAKGIVPADLSEETVTLNIQSLVDLFVQDAHPSEKDRSALRLIVKAKGGVPLRKLDSAWVDAWISEMKRVDNLAPATIRSRVGALARCTDWGVRKGHLTLPDQAFRSLPDGYATYTRMDASFAGRKRVDVERDRRLEPGEYEAILALIDKGVLPRKQRPLVLEYQPAVRCLFVLAVETAMRLREMYTLTTDQVDLSKRTVFLDKTKNGDKRQVPLSSVAIQAFKDYLAVREIPDGHNPNAVFPWWNGEFDGKKLNRVSSEIGKLFQNSKCNGIFDIAGCEDLNFHDLRHEATSRLFEKTNLSELEIAKITGHKSLRMLSRYANLRGSNLANRLW